jgi:hypothetical protein
MSESMAGPWFLAVLVMALGFSMCAVAVDGPSFIGGNAQAVLWLAGGAIIGAGAMTPMKHPIIGAVIGFVIQLVIIYEFLRALANGLDAL